MAEASDTPKSASCNRADDGSCRTRACPTYWAWCAMRRRCSGGTAQYPRYAGRGIKVCERWQTFAAFLDDMGCRPSPELSIDRIDPDGDYEPNNCKWSTQKEQCNNWSRRRHLIIKYHGREYTLQQLSERLGVHRYSLRGRIFSRWPVEYWGRKAGNFVPDRRMSDEEFARTVFPPH